MEPNETITFDSFFYSKSSKAMLAKFCTQNEISFTNPDTVDLSLLSDEKLRDFHSYLVESMLNTDVEFGGGFGVVEGTSRYFGSLQAHYVYVKRGLISYTDKDRNNIELEITEPGLVTRVDCIPLGTAEPFHELQHQSAAVVLDDSIGLINIIKDEAEALEEKYGRDIVYGAINITNETMSNFAVKSMGFHEVETIDSPSLSELQQNDSEKLVFIPYEEMDKNIDHLKKLRDQTVRLGIKRGSFSDLRNAREILIKHILNKMDEE